MTDVAVYADQVVVAKVSAAAVVLAHVKVQAGIGGPPGPQAQWTHMTQAEYDALLIKDPDTLYVIVG